MKDHRSHHRTDAAATATAALAAVLLLLAGAAGADDRDLVREGGREPYVMVLFDVSGSMNWQPPNEALGIPGDAWAPGYGDDPNSKFYQAKSALFKVLSDPALKDVFWGFSTYNQDNVRVYRKHWLYTPLETPPWVTSDLLPYPQPGDPKHFGDDCMDDADADTGCDLDSNDIHGSCESPRDVDDPEQFGELLSFPVLDDDGGTDTVEWVRHNGRIFQLTWDLVSGPMGADTLRVRITLQEHAPDGDDDGTACDGPIGGAQTFTADYGPVYTEDNNGLPLPGSNQVLFWQIDDETDAAGNPGGFFDPDDTRATNTCAGWEGNDDSAADATVGVNLKYQTTADPDARHAFAFDRGDVIPLDWKSEEVWGESSRDLMLRRLAPNFNPDTPSIFPDFRVATYFQDHPDSITNGRLELRSQFVNTPPLLPSGSTPIGNSMRDFMNWYDQWHPVATGASGDEFLGCRSVNVLVLTDGDETCYGGSTTGQTDSQGDANPCWIAERLLEESGRDIRTFVIGFGVQGGTSNFLDCIAEKGGTDAIDIDGDGEIDITGPILPGNEQELVDALRQVISAIRGRPRSFASAAVPQGQANVRDKVFLTSFLPLNGEPIWRGRVDAFLRPVPLTEIDVELPDGSVETRLVPDTSRVCGPSDESECHLWDAGTELLDEQAASDTQIGDGSFNLGSGEGQRRTYYSIDRGGSLIPDQRRFFKAPVSDEQWQDLLYGMEICAPGDTACAALSTRRDRATEVLEFTHQVKTAADPENPGEMIEYLLGDVFHSDLRVAGNPENFQYWVSDVGGSGTLPLEQPCATSPDGYRCFFDMQRLRRRMLVAGSNDGQLHAFDAGVFRGSCQLSPVTNQQVVVGEFDNGTGRELFSYVPRPALPTLKELKDGREHRFSVDGAAAFGDALIDPIHGGSPNADEREWRSLLVAGLREGGSGYYALDVTQPDDLDDCDGTPVLPKPLPGTLSYVPSCLNGACGTLPFPSLLWEFNDDRECAIELPDGRCDDDADGRPDFADSWSIPNLGRVRVLESVGGEDVIRDRYVAVVGGGMDVAAKGLPVAGGNFVFMIDVETGRALYKRRLPAPAPGRRVGSAASEPAAVDTNQDGYLDTAYIGTTEGLLYKVDMSQPVAVEDVSGIGERILAEEWDPFPVFDTGGRPIYFPPAVVFVAELGQYALAFGTGDREDLWETTDQEGRLYMILDRDFRRDGFVLDGTLPKKESDFQAIPADGQPNSSDFLRNTPFGWFIRLADEERVITRAFSLAGITVFSSFQPDERVSQDGTVCLRRGNSRAFVVTTTNANALLSSGSRYFVIRGGFLSPPFAETGITKNPASGSGGDTADDLPDNLNEVLQELKKMFPRNCRFANYTINIKAVRDDTGIEFLAAVPVCTVQSQWKDF